MKRSSVAIVGAAESTRMGKIIDVSETGLQIDSALNALEDAGLKPGDIDGIATAEAAPADLAFLLGIKPRWIDGTSVGGAAFMLHVRHAAAAIESGLCETVLIVHGESGRSRVGWFHPFGPASLIGQFDMPYGMAGAPNIFTLPALRYMQEFGVSEEDIARVAVVQREWAMGNPRATLKDPVTVEEVLASRMVAWPFRKLMCCLVTDGGGAIVLTKAERAKDFPQPPVYLWGAGEAAETSLTGIAWLEDPIRPGVIRESGRLAFESAGINHSDVDHLMIYDAFAHTPLFGLEGLGFVDYGEAASFVSDGHTRPGGSLPMNTNGGGLCYMHSGMYGMYAIQESVRQLRGVAPAQVENCEVSVAHGFGGFFSACGTLVLGNST